jgi:hypothetical protein
MTDEDREIAGIEDHLAITDIEDRLAKLRDPIPPEMISKRPQPMWKNAWDDGQKRKCSECGMFHVLENTLHLDYCGHAVVTDRLLEADPFWSWEPLSVDDRGLPRYDQFGGLWIKLTVRGVTRLGYGDAVGKAPSTTAVKEIIGDALRNAGMRFGIALELWSRADFHRIEEPGGKTSGDTRHSGRESSGGTGAADAVGAPPLSRSENQDALDALASVCNEHGLDLRTVAERFTSDHDADIRTASAGDITAFTTVLLAEMTPEPDDGAYDGTEQPPGGEPLF